MEDLIICLVAYMDFAFRLDLVLGWFPVIAIAPTARPNRPAKRDCPGRSDLPLRGHSGPIGLDFFAQVAPTWVPGPSKHSIPCRSGVDIRKSSFSAQSSRRLGKKLKQSCQLRAEPAKLSQKLAKAALKVLHSLHFDIIFDDFSSLLRGIVEKVVL